MAKLSIQEYFNKLRAAGQVLAEEDMPLEIAARDTVAVMFERIFINGKDRNGAAIGKYDTNRELYANPKMLPRAVPVVGKNGDKGNVGEKPRKTAYFENYKALRAAMGVNTKYVDLHFSGRLAFNFVNSSVSPSSSTMSKKAVSSKDISLEKINKLTYAIRLNKENTAKAKGAQFHFRAPIFLKSKAEKENFIKVLKFETIRLLNV